MRPLDQKSSVDEIRRRFDVDVDRFSQLETGQRAAMDALVMLELVSAVAATRLAAGARLLDLGCGAGNLSLSVLGRVPGLNCVLVDLSGPMLDRAARRVREASPAGVETIQLDMRDLDFAPGSFDAVVAGAVLHHLRDDDDWRAMFGRLHDWLRPGGTLLVSDLASFDDPAVQGLMNARYGEYLSDIGGDDYRDSVFAYVDREDSPRSLTYQFARLREAGFRDCDVLHRHAVFAAYYATK